MPVCSAQLVTPHLIPLQGSQDKWCRTGPGFATRPSFSGRDLQLCNPHPSVFQGRTPEGTLSDFPAQSLHRDGKYACKPCREEDRRGCLKQPCLGAREGAVRQGRRPPVTPGLLPPTPPSERAEGFATKPFTCTSPTKHELFYIVGTTLSAGFTTRSRHF